MRNTCHISCIRRPLLFSCAARTAVGYARLGALSHSAYLCAGNIRRLVYPKHIGWSRTSHRLFTQRVFFFHIRLVVKWVPDQRTWSLHTLSPTYQCFQSAASKNFVLLAARAIVKSGCLCRLYVLSPVSFEGVLGKDCWNN